MNSSETYPVLIAEDEEAERLLIKRAIRKSNLPITPYLVFNGIEAQNYLLGVGIYENRSLYPLPKLLITNVRMHRMGGLELVTWIKEQPNLKDLPIIVSISSETPKERQQFDRLGVNYYFTKPVSINLLTQAIQTLLLDST